MALVGGHRFAVSMGDVAPRGLAAMGVEQAEDYDEATGRRSPATDKLTGELVWTVTCIDLDPAARKKEIKVKVTAPVIPVLPDEAIPGTGLRLVEFSGLTVTPYVDESGRRARMAFSFRATGVHAQGKAPATPTGPAGPTGAHTASGAKPADGKAA